MHSPHAALSSRRRQPSENILVVGAACKHVPYRVPAHGDDSRVDALESKLEPAITHHGHTQPGARSRAGSVPRCPASGSREADQGFRPVSLRPTAEEQLNIQDADTEPQPTSARLDEAVQHRPV
jgi:hypothetical protein